MLSEGTNQIHTETHLVREPTKHTQKDSRLFGYQETHSISSLKRPREEDWEFQAYLANLAHLNQKATRAGHGVTCLKSQHLGGRVWQNLIYSKF